MAMVTCGTVGALATQGPLSSLDLLTALHLMLEHDPNVAIERTRLDAASGSLLVASGKFDSQLKTDLTQAVSKIPLSASSIQDFRTLQTNVDYSQLFRTGLSIEPRLQLLHSLDAASRQGSVNTATLTFQIRQPLLRGRGRAATDAAELAAAREVTATLLDLRHTVAQRILAVGSQYWTVAAAAANLEVLRASETSSSALLENTRKLIAADVVPAAELVQLEANLAAKQSSRIGGERQLFQARQDLGRQIGLDPAENARLPVPSDAFPTLAVPPAAGAELAAPHADSLVREALLRRADLQAARQRQREAEILLLPARNALLPQLDLVLAPGYSGLAGGSSFGDLFAPLANHVPGASASLSLSLTLPIKNLVAAGQLAQVEANQRQSAFAVDLLVKTVGANVPAALDAVHRDSWQLERAREAVKLFERAVVNEEKKLRAGTSTIIDVITQRDRLDGARQVDVAAKLALAVALLQLRFETGTLVGGDQEEAVIDPSRLTTPPLPEEGSP